MELLKRALFTIRAGLTRRRELREILGKSGCDEVTQLSAERLAAEGCLVLVLDFDGVLAPHGHAEPLPETILWLDRCVGFAGLKRVYVLSNKPSQVREEFFRKKYPAIRFVRAGRKKPYPDGLLAIIRDEAVEPRQVLIVDDRLLTGVLSRLSWRASGASISRAPIGIFAAGRLPNSFFPYCDGWSGHWCGWRIDRCDKAIPKTINSLIPQQNTCIPPIAS